MGSKCKLPVCQGHRSEAPGQGISTTLDTEEENIHHHSRILQQTCCGVSTHASRCHQTWLGNQLLLMDFLTVLPPVNRGGVTHGSIRTEAPAPPGRRGPRRRTENNHHFQIRRGPRCRSSQPPPAQAARGPRRRSTGNPPAKAGGGPGTQEHGAPSPRPARGARDEGAADWGFAHRSVGHKRIRLSLLPQPKHFISLM
ncbi:unnamed protein product [Pleuronectes platessa]|uniref:Uncharacterized protein n=1 Tax=Pleuronectes platessa TaxID=8262 RepID=A0A9N7UQN5_PLEPL|nr:unnamed protein product [Pleuronectes platessa]